MSVVPPIVNLPTGSTEIPLSRPSTDLPWVGRRLPLRIAGVGGDFLSDLTTPVPIIDSDDTNRIFVNDSLLPFLTNSRDGTHQNEPIRPTTQLVSDQPSVDQITIRIGTYWIGMFDLDQQPQKGIVWSISYDSFKNGVFQSKTTKTFTVDERSHPANTYQNATPYAYFYTEDVRPLRSGTDTYSYGGFKVESVTIPPYYNP